MSCTLMLLSVCTYEVSVSHETLFMEHGIGRPVRLRFYYSLLKLRDDTSKPNTYHYLSSCYQTYCMRLPRPVHAGNEQTHSLWSGRLHCVQYNSPRVARSGRSEGRRRRKQLRPVDDGASDISREKDRRQK